MESNIGYIFAIVFIVIALNIFFLRNQFRRGNNYGRRRRRRGSVAPDEAKQALWRDKEVARRIEREQDDAYECVVLRNETLAYYDEVRRRHANEDEYIDQDLFPLNSERERYTIGYNDDDFKRVDPDLREFPERFDGTERVSMIPFDDDIT